MSAITHNYPLSPHTHIQCTIESLEVTQLFVEGYMGRRLVPSMGRGDAWILVSGGDAWFLVWGGGGGGISLSHLQT